MRKLVYKVVVILPDEGSEDDEQRRILASDVMEFHFADDSMGGPDVSIFDSDHKLMGEEIIDWADVDDEIEGDYDAWLERAHQEIKDEFEKD